MLGGRAVDALPTPLSTFIGRGRQIADVERLLASGRLVTLAGPGGCGKTRLALATAARVRGRFRDGVVFVPLAQLHDPGAVAAAVAQSLGIPERPGLSHAEAVRLGLGGRALLLVLDNFEHLLDAAPTVSSWLSACPDVTVLATSRERLRLQGEQVYTVPPLSLQDAPDAGPGGSEAVRLFVERARAVQPGFALTDDIRPIVAEICARLDGLPLAIELAAARVGVLPPRALVTRLERRLPLLTAGARDLPARQRTLRAALDWSHDLLDEPERVLFRRLAVFAGGFDLHGVAAVAGSSGQEHLLEALVDQSLVYRDAVPSLDDASEGEPRFGMLETIREYALEHLAASGEEETIRSRQAAHVVALAEAAAPQLTGPLQPRWLRRLDQEYPNVRAALQWLFDRGDADLLGLRLATALGRYWWLRSRFSEGRAQIRRFLDLAGRRASPTARADALQVLGELAFRQGVPGEARRLLEEALAVRRRAGDAPGTALALRSLGRLAIDEGRHDEARTLLEGSLALERGLGHRQGLPWGLSYLGWLAIFDGDHARARALLDEGLRLCQELGDREGVGRHHLSLGHLALDRGDLAGAQASFAESLAIFGALDYRYGIAYALEGLADVALAGGQDAEGLRIAGAAAALREATGAAPAAEFRARHERRVARARERLGEGRAAAAWAEGQALPLDRVASPGRVARHVAAPERSAAPGDAARPLGLTPRQVEVVRLVAEGRSNREIAEALVVSERTVATHLDHIFSKLGVSSRTAVAMFALRSGLT